MQSLKRPAQGILRQWISGLRFPWLVGIAAALFVIDLFIPDALPFVDEIILAAVMAGLASFRKKRRERAAGEVPASIENASARPPR